MLYIFSPTFQQLQQYLLTIKIVPKHFCSCMKLLTRISKTELVPTFFAEIAPQDLHSIRV